MRSDPRMRRAFGPAIMALSIAIGTQAITATTSRAGLVTVGGGYDFYSGPAGQQTHAVLGTVGVGLPVVSASVTGMRYDDNLAGKGSSVTGGLGLGVFPMTTLRIFGTRYIGDDTYRAWRVKTGPQIGLPTGQSVGLYYSYYRDDSDVTSNGAVGELGVPLIAGWSARATVSYATVPGGLRSRQGSVGLSFKPMHMLELSGEVGLAKNGAPATQPVPSGTGLELPLIGGGGSPGQTGSDGGTSTETTALLGIRVWFP